MKPRAGGIALSRTIITIRQQRGAVAIIVALSIFVLIGMIGLAIDLGRMFVIKTELQNAADACALAAAKELNGLEGAKTRADAVGILVGTRNEINFQDEAAPVTAASLTYSDSLSPNSGYNRTIDDGDAKYVMCTVNRPNIGMLFMGVLGFGPQRVSAYAVATLAPSQTTCALPVGICQPTPGNEDDPEDPFGLLAGKWYSGKFDPIDNLTGSFNWLDFNPTGGGQNELSGLLGGEGQCELPVEGTCVGEQGDKAGAVNAWNSRFGLVQGPFNNLTTPRPDYTGRGYVNTEQPYGIAVKEQGITRITSWPNPVPQNAYKGTCTVTPAYIGDPDDPDDDVPAVTCLTPNYVTAAGIHDPYDPSTPSDPAGVLSGLSVNVLDAELANGTQRRVALAPIVDCRDFKTNSPGCEVQQVKIKGWACVLMLSPINGPDEVVLEYLGQPDAEGVPCGSFGLAGDADSNGPLVPTLVQ